jgi:hypothetical protein
MKHWIKDDGGRVEAGFIHEFNDCTVRALALSMQLPYAQAHAIMQSLGRPNKQGWYFHQLESYDHIVEACQGKVFKKFGNQHCTVQTYIRNHLDGTYVLRMGHHVCCVIDGVAHDLRPWNNLKNCHVMYGYNVIQNLRQIEYKPLDTERNM